MHPILRIIIAIIIGCPLGCYLGIKLYALTEYLRDRHLNIRSRK